MSRPAVSVVMPFAGDEQAAAAALGALLAIETRERDELILADNTGVAPQHERVLVVQAVGERSPAHARNAGAQRARNDWILFLDADCRPWRGLLDGYFAEPVSEDVGALAGEVLPAPDAVTLAGRYGAARGFLSQQAHLEHPYMPRAVAANLLVRRAAFEALGGFYEGVRAAEDTDFSWRLQRAGWRLERRPGARVEHVYRTSLRDLRAQWRGYAAGRAWLARRYHDFKPQPAVVRAAMRGWRRLRGSSTEHRGAGAVQEGRTLRARYLALDALLSADELAGLALSNRPRAPSHPTADVVLVAERFPERGDPLAEFARRLEHARVEAVMRPESLDPGAFGALSVTYREDDGAAARAVALATLMLRHPARCIADLARRERGQPTLAALAPAVRRLQRDLGARVHPLGGREARTTALRMAALAGRQLDGAR